MLLEYVEINLDSCGKHFLVLALLVPQLASIATFCILYYQYYMRECNPAAFEPSVPWLHKILTVNLALSIIFKCGSVVCLRLALEEYENLSSNTSYFLTAIMMSVSPSTLLAPLYTLDHFYCMPRNFVMP